MATTYLSRSFTAGNTDKWTFSAWVKRCPDGNAQFIFSGWADANNYTGMYFDTDESLHFYNRSGGGAAGQQVTTRLFRDNTAWLNLVFVWDSGNATSGDRMRIYVNGEEVTHFAVDNMPTQDLDSSVNANGNTCYVGQRGNGLYWNGLMSHIHFCDGQAYAASDFGETDATTGEWKWKNPSGLTYGTNGFFILKDSNSVTDQSGESNNFTVGAGTLTTTKDCPNNNICTLNPLHHNKENLSNGTIEYKHGNTQMKATNTAGNAVTLSTFAVDKGKYYCEAKLTAIGGAYPGIGILGTNQSNSIYGSNEYIGKYSNGWTYGSNGSGNSLLNSDSWASYGDSYTTGDYIGIALDMDNNKLYYSKNGTWQNSGTGISITAGKTYHFGCNGNNNCIWDWNFGNGVFGETALTGTTYNGSDGNGIFKYDPNNITLDSTTKSFKSLTTKGLNA